jgi:K+-sensing histidine kinase KdpD
MIESSRARLWAFVLALMTIFAAVTVALINPIETAAVYLILLLGVVVIGLLTNIWGGLAASAVSVFVIVLINQYTGVTARENAILNVATELAACFFVGPLAGGLAGAIDRVQHEADRWLARAEELTVHDETFGTLKPDWSMARLDEEILRARRFKRPLSIALLELTPKSETVSRVERIAALEAVIRIARAVTQPPIIVTHSGAGQIMIIMPEHTLDQAQQSIAAIQSQAKSEKYFPNGSTQALGKPIGEWGDLKAGLAEVSGRADNAQSLIESAKQSIH